MAKKRTAFICGKLCEAPEGDYFVTCSFDKNHILLRSRMPFHIIKCLKQHPGHNKIQCPYDATEYIDQDQYDNHILICESKRSYVDEKYETAKLKASGQMCNLQQTPFFHTYAPKVDEDWGGSGSSGNYEDEIMSEDLRGVGRGIRSKNQMPNKGMGRAEILKHILESHNENRSPLGSKSSSSSEKDNSRREGVCSRQFEDS